MSWEDDDHHNDDDDGAAYPIYERFKVFHRNNPHIFAEIVRRAEAVRSAGAKRFGIAAIFESMRYDTAIRTLSQDYKLENNFKPYYARLLAVKYPELGELFVLHACLADEAMAVA